MKYKLNCAFIGINPDAVDFNIFKEISKIHRHIKKSSKKSLIDKISKRLLELESVENYSLKSQCLKWIVKKYSLHYKNMLIYCKKCNKHIANTFPKKINLISKKKIKEKSRCAICLTKRVFIDEIEGDLEIGLEIYLQFFTDSYYRHEDSLLEV